MCGRGEIGRRSRLKICLPYGNAGSSPAVRTISKRVVASAALGFVLVLAGCEGDAPRRALTVTTLADQPDVIAETVAPGLVAFDADGQIEPARAERWIVSDDGLSLDFRLSRQNGPEAHAATAAAIAASLTARVRTTAHGRLGGLLSAIDSIVPMTGRVVEVRLKRPQPDVLQLLAQPEFGISLRGARGDRYEVVRSSRTVITLRPTMAADAPDATTSPEALKTREVNIRFDAAPLALARYRAGRDQAVINGRFTDYPYVRAAHIAAAQIVIDPAQGLFGLAFSGSSASTADPKIREALAMAIDRTALAATLGLPSWSPRQTLLPAQPVGGIAIADPDWATARLADRRTEAATRVARAASASSTPLRIRVQLPDGPGARLLFARIAADWHAIGVEAVRVGHNDPADVFLIDEVAPSAGPAWYFNRLSCAHAVRCARDVDATLSEAQQATSPSERAALLPALDKGYARVMPFIPLGSPFRWAITSPMTPGLHPSPAAVHPIRHLRGD